jgi:hypothetical protein
MGSLAELDYDHTMHEREHAGDEKLYVRFFPEVLPDVEASDATGMRKFKDVTMVQIMVPGAKYNIVVREAREDDLARFPKQYDLYKAGKDEDLTGFPLREWPLCTRAMTEELRYLGFRTVEHVANATDGAMGKNPGLRELQKRAASWLQLQKETAPLEQALSAIEHRDKEIAAMKAQMEEMTKALRQLQSK